MSERTPTRIEQQVAKLPRAYRELWVERSGILMHNGMRQRDADVQAYEWIIEAMKQVAE